MNMPSIVQYKKSGPCFSDSPMSVIGPIRLRPDYVFAGLCPSADAR